ncbi:MAG: divalent-cation tolerance protein CutA [Limnochordales bacterium]|nr:divalent-cation tolerance protein CutA [Limnochordales bacterium]
MTVREHQGANPEAGVYLVYTTVSNAEEGAALGRQVVAERLAACANLIPQIRSFYWWEGRLVDDTESFLILKTTGERLPALIARLKELHSYTVPAINAVRLDAGHPDYWQWVQQVVGEFSGGESR